MRPGRRPSGFSERIAEACVRRDERALRRVRSALTSSKENGLEGREALVEVVRHALAAIRGENGLAPQSSAVEAQSLAARMLLEIAGGVAGSNADLADRLDTDQSQLSRAGRRLRDLGLATRSRSGRVNGWVLTREGQREAVRLRSC